MSTTFWKGIDKPHHLPGPRRLPLLGSNLSIGKIEHTYRAMENWIQQYGDPCYAVIGKYGYILTANMELARMVLDSRPEGARRSASVAESIRTIHSEDNLFSVEGDQWKNQRKAITKSLSAHNLKKAEEMIVAEAKLQMTLWEALRLGMPASEPINALPLTRRFALRIICQLVFGVDFRNLSTSDQLIDEVSLIFQTLARRLVAPVSYWTLFRTPQDRAFDTAYADLAADIDQLAARCKMRLAEMPQDYKPETLLEGLLIDRGPDSPALTTKEVRDNCIGLVSAGLDTTSSSLAWALFELGRNPQWQAALYEELDIHSGGTLELSTLQGVGALPKMEAVLWETLRLHSPAPFIGTNTLREFEFEGQRIPAGASFFFLTSLAEKQRHDFDPSFNPQRWHDSGLLNQAVKLLPIPFGLGQRLCPGRNLSMMEMKAFLAQMVARYTWTVPAGFVPQEKFNFTLEPSDVPLVLKPRKS